MASWKAALAAMNPCPSSGEIDASRSMAACSAAMCSGFRFLRADRRDRRHREDAGLHQLAVRAAAHPQEERPHPTEVADVGLADDGTARRARPHLEDAAQLQDPERLAQRAPPRVELLHHDDLGLEAVAVLQPGRRDPIDKRPSDRLGTLELAHGALHPNRFMPLLTSLPRDPAPPGGLRCTFTSRGAPAGHPVTHGGDAHLVDGRHDFSSEQLDALLGGVRAACRRRSPA